MHSMMMDTKKDHHHHCHGSRGNVLPATGHVCIFNYMHSHRLGCIYRGTTFLQFFWLLNLNMWSGRPLFFCYWGGAMISLNGFVCGDNPAVSPQNWLVFWLPLVWAHTLGVFFLILFLWAVLALLQLFLWEIFFFASFNFTTPREGQSNTSTASLKLKPKPDTKFSSAKSTLVVWSAVWANETITTAIMYWW